MKNDLSLHKVLINKRVQGWVRPADWLPMPDIPAGEQKVVILFGVYNGVGNIPKILTASGNYIVDWGDGSSPQNSNSGTPVGHQYDYSALPESSVCSRGYKQVLITITPQAGFNLTSLTIYDDYRLYFAALDISIRSSYLTSLSLRSLYHLERLSILGSTALTSRMTDGFAPALQSFNAPEATVNLTSCSQMFKASRLTEIDLNLSGKTVNDLSGFAENAECLQRVNLHGVNLIGSATNAFYSCTSLLEIDGIDVSGATSFSGLVSSCRRLYRANITGISITISFSYTSLTRESIVEIFNNLAVVTGQTITITGTPGALFLSAAERAIATDKGWTITG
ncbi:MAG: hypothetical protein AAGU26_10590 [bacterium]